MLHIPLGNDWFQVIRKPKKSKSLESSSNRSSKDKLEYSAPPSDRSYSDNRPVNSIDAGSSRYMPRSTKLGFISLEFRKALQNARQKKNYTRAQLARLINEKESIIIDYENGTGAPNHNIINKLNTALDIVLPKLQYKKINFDQ